MAPLETDLVFGEFFPSDSRGAIDNLIFYLLLGNHGKILIHEALIY